MPIDVAVAVGGVAGGSTVSLRRSFQAGLAEKLQSELDLAVESVSEIDDAGWEERIRQMLALRQLHPVFQPIYSLDDGRLVAVEALTRFDTEPQHPPDVWFSHAAGFGLGVELELVALELALADGVGIPGEVALTFNASPSTLAALRLRGVRLAVADAGAGFASLRHIVRLAPDYIKLDPSLTQNLRADPVRSALAEALIQFADRTGSAIIVEGIETPADLAIWQDLGAHAA